MNTIKFFALADFGRANDLVRKVAAAMHEFATIAGDPHVVLGIGDNFYPDGVDSVNSKQFQTTWRDIFLKYTTLRVPWKMILGNHDYMSNPTAQIDYHYHQNNVGGYWNLPSYCYSFLLDSKIPDSIVKDSIDAVNLNDKVFRAEFFGLDTNGCQKHVREVFPETEHLLREYICNLDKELKASDAHWKIVFGHHPLYTQGKSHGLLADCLRSDNYTYTRRDSNCVNERSTRSNSSTECSAVGYGLERVLVENGVHAYFGGHEHVFQCHFANNVHHFGCGATGGEYRSELYGGTSSRIQLDWVASTKEMGFVAVEATYDYLTVKFIDVHLDVLKEVIIPHPLTLQKPPSTQLTE